MKILHASGTFLPTKGGCPYFIHNLTQHLRNRGDKCRVVTTGRGENLEIETVSTFRSKSIELAGFPISPNYPFLLRRVIESFSPDVIHTHYPLPVYPEIASILSKYSEVPLIITCHGAFEMTWDSFIGIFGSIYNRTLLHASLRSADYIHVSNKEILSEFSLFDGYDSKIEIIPMGVDTKWFNPKLVSGDPPYPVEPNLKTILYVGAFRRYKGLDNLIAAFDRLVTTDVQLVLIGDGPMRDQIETAISSRDLEDKVVSPGHVADEYLRRAYAKADVFVLPSPTMSESFGLVALEAMAMGVPTIVTNGSGIGSILQEVNAGMVVEPGCPRKLSRAIEQLLYDRESRQTQIGEGKKLIDDEFAWRELIQDYRDLYRKVL